MKSILENRPALAAEVNKVAEVAGISGRKVGQNVMGAILRSTSLSL